MARHRPAPLLFATALALASLSACDVAREVTTAITQGPTFSPELVDTPTGDQLAWTLSAINDRGGDVPDDELAAHFTPRFLERMDPARLRGWLVKVAETGAPVTARDLQQADRGRLALLTESATGPSRVLLGVDPTTGLIDSLLFQPYLDASFPELLDAVPALSPAAQLLVAEVDHGACVPLYEVDADAALPIAGAAKLYVLLALVDAIAGGELSWDTPLALRDDWKSDRRSVLGRAHAGDTLPLRGFADNLIASDDDSAHDHLVRVLGRERVEAAVRDSGHHEPARNIPYPTARELAHQQQLAPEELARYDALSEADRRTYLDEVLLTRPPLPSADRPLRPDRPGVVASATDLCGALATLVERAHTRPGLAPALEILTRGVNTRPGIARDTWPYVGGKRGAAWGVRTRTWLLRRDDDRWFAVILGVDDGLSVTKPDEHLLAAITWRIFDLLADEDR